MGDKTLLSIIYHDIFDYPLTARELIKWETNINQKLKILPAGGHGKSQNINYKDGYYFLRGRGELVAMRLNRNKIAKRKMTIAKSAARIIGLIPTIRFVGVTGALAMENTTEASDIDLLLITSADTLWLTRPFVYLLLGLSGFKIRHFGEPNEKDRLCLNMWLDEDSLVWPVKLRSIYSAHEFGQLLPLVNKNNTYEHLMYKNKWLKDYWPNTTKVYSTERIVHRGNTMLRFMNKIAFWIQKRYMLGKITRETITESKAIFHPIDWSSKVDEIITVALQR